MHCERERKSWTKALLFWCFCSIAACEPEAVLHVLQAFTLTLAICLSSGSGQDQGTIFSVSAPDSGWLHGLSLQSDATADTAWARYDAVLRISLSYKAWQLGRVHCLSCSEVAAWRHAVETKMSL